jgi:hypothetical protein
MESEENWDRHFCLMISPGRGKLDLESSLTLPLLFTKFVLLSDFPSKEVRTSRHLVVTWSSQDVANKEQDVANREQDVAC